MITFEIVLHHENNKKMVLAKVSDVMTANMLEGWYRGNYQDSERFTVTMRYPYKKSIKIN